MERAHTVDLILSVPKTSIAIAGMAPPRAPLELPSEHPEGYDEFIESLVAFTDERGYDLAQLQYAIRQSLLTETLMTEHSLIFKLA